MRIFNTRTRMTIGLASMLTTVLMVALWLGLVPDRRTDVLEGRATLCETIAVNASAMVTQRDLRRLDLMLHTIVARKPGILSAGVRRSDGKLLCELADHERYWKPLRGNRSNDSQVQVPIRQSDAQDGSKWGSVEIRFRPLSRPGLMGFLTDPHLRLIVFVALASLLLVYFYLGRVLKQVDASKAVPSHVRSALDTLAEGLLLLDSKQRIVFANEAFAAKLALPSSELLGRRISELSWCNDDCSQTPATFPWTQLFEDGQQNASQLMRLCPDGGDRRTVLVNCCPITADSGQIRGALVSLDDVTELEEQKAELQRAKAEAETANRTKSEFLANMSHEIRTPMNAILGFADVLRRGLAETDDDRQEYLDTIHSSGTFLLELINDILDLSKIESGRLEVERTSCSPHKVIADVVEVLGVKARETGLTLEFAAATPIPENVVSDPTRLRQILTNLVGNALKFTQRGGVKVVARLLEDGPSPQLGIDVVDTGIGIAPDRLDTVFDAFTQADASITRQFGGTGLGLAISRRFAEALGGTLTATSRPGQGSTFTVTLDTGPLEGVALLDGRQLQKRTRQASRPADGVPQSLHDARVLVVDDGDANRRLIQLVLCRAGAVVEEAINGQEAVDRVRAEEFDVILMDMQMPVMDGYTATRLLRETGVKQPVVALTANAMKGDEEKCRAAGCSGFLAKPVDLDELIRVVSAELLGREFDRARPASGLGTGAELAGTEPQPAGACPTTERVTNDLPVSKAELEAQAAPIEKQCRGAGVAACSCEPNGSHRGTMAGVAPSDRGKIAHGATAASDDSPNVDRPPLRSNLPMNDPEFRRIAVDFVARLDEKLAIMDDARQRADLDELADLAHWLKGAGGTVGFGAFTLPAQQLEQCAKSGQTDDLERLLREVKELARSIDIPAADAAAQCS